MKRRQFTLLLLLLASVTSWFTRSLWLPPILAQLPRIEERADLLQALDAIVNLAALIVNGLLACLLWLSRREEKTEPGLDSDVLRPINPQRMCENMGRGGQVEWLDRHASHVSTLRSHGRLMITGRMKAGKTREAAELIRRAISEDLLPEHRVYEPGPSFRLQGEKLSSSLRELLDPHLPILLFLDDLPYHFSGQGLQQLDQAFDVLQECKTAYIVATARLDQLTEHHLAWLAQQHFHNIDLFGLDEDQTGQLLDRAASTFELHIDDAARSEFIDTRDGTPELIIASLRRLRADQYTRVDLDAARGVTRNSLTEAWAETRRYLQGRYQAASPLFGALAAFHTAGVRPYESLVLHYAARLSRRRSHWPRSWFPMLNVRRALAHLAEFDIIGLGGEITYPDVAVEGLISPGDAQEALLVFLVRHRRTLYRQCILRHWPFRYSQFLRKLHPDANDQMTALYDLARGVKQRGQTDTAIRFYTAALDTRSDLNPFLGGSLLERLHQKTAYDQALVDRALAYESLGDRQSAIADYTEGIGAGGLWAVDIYFCRAEAYRESGELDAAIADYDRAIALREDFGRISVALPRTLFYSLYTSRARVRREQGNLRGAITDYTCAIELDPEDAAAYINRGLAYDDQGELEAAIADYSRAIELDPQDTAAYFNRGLAYDDQGELEAAIADYSRAIELDPQDTAAYFRRADEYVRTGDFGEAIADYTRAIQLDPERASIYYHRGLAHLGLDKLIEAINDFTQALVLNPQQAEVYVWRGHAYARTDELQKAVADYTHAIKLDDHDARAYTGCGNVHFAQGDMEKAITDYSRAIELDPESPGAYYNRGLAHVDQGELEAAITDYSRAIELEPENTAAYFNRGLAYWHQGKMEQAVADYSRTIEINPKSARAYYNRGLAHADRGELEAAIADYTRAIELDPTNAAAYYSRGLAHDEQGKLEAAIADYSRTIELKPENGAAYFCRGFVYWQRGELEAATADLDRVLTLSVDPEMRRMAEEQLRVLQAGD